jgi:hypothetical protein
MTENDQKVKSHGKESTAALALLLWTQRNQVGQDTLRLEVTGGPIYVPRNFSVWLISCRRDWNHSAKGFLARSVQWCEKMEDWECVIENPQWGKKGSKGCRY